jgi:hypothetical protein
MLNKIQFNFVKKEKSRSNFVWYIIGNSISNRCVLYQILKLRKKFCFIVLFIFFKFSFILYSFIF